MQTFCQGTARLALVLQSSAYLKSNKHNKHVQRPESCQCTKWSNPLCFTFLVWPSPFLHDLWLLDVPAISRKPILNASRASTFHSDSQLGCRTPGIQRASHPASCNSPCFSSLNSEQIYHYCVGHVIQKLSVSQVSEGEQRQTSLLCKQVRVRPAAVRHPGPTVNGKIVFTRTRFQEVARPDRFSYLNTHPFKHHEVHGHQWTPRSVRVQTHLTCSGETGAMTLVYRARADPNHPSDGICYPIDWRWFYTWGSAEIINQ